VEARNHDAAAATAPAAMPAPTEAH